MGETHAAEFGDDLLPGAVPADRGSKDANIERAQELKRLADTAGSAHPEYRAWFLRRAYEYLKAAHKDR